MKTGLPYIPDVVGAPITMKPYIFSDSKLAIFFLDCTVAALNAQLDTYINKPSGDRYAYRCLGVDGKTFALMLMAQMTMNVRSPAAVEYGKERYSELSFWIPCYDLKGLKFRAALFLPFLFPDSETAIATGREMFGFRKQLASYTYPKGELDLWNPEFTASTIAWKTMGPDSVAQRYDLVSLPKAQSEVQEGETWTDKDKLVAGVTQNFLGKHWTNEKGEILGIINDLLDDIPCIFLKQFPDVADAQVAEVRSIASAPLQLYKIYGAFPWIDRTGLKTFDLQFAKLASHPIVAQLGLTPTSSTEDAFIVPTKGFWMKIDFGLGEGKTMETVPAPKQRIAVLGGGLGSLAAVYGITEDPDWQQKYEITLYQMGWRLGGKGASGRNREIADRIEEHGLHVWFGYYENAFRVIQACYEELDRPANAPLATWSQAFKPQSTILVEEYFRDKWRHWMLAFRPDDEVPGQGEPMNDHPLGVFTHLRLSGEALHRDISRLVKDAEQSHGHATKTANAFKPAKPSGESAAVSFFHAATHAATGALKEVTELVVEGAEHDLDGFLANFKSKLEIFPQPGADHAALAKGLVGDVLKHWFDVLLELQSLIEQFLKPFGEALDSIRRLVTLFELGLAIAKGILRDGVLIHGFSAINQYDFTAWLIQNGASQEAANSAIVRAFYDLYLGFPNGQNVIVGDGVAIGGNVSAGELLHSYILVTLCYKGAIMWKMQAGMGDVVMTPLYQVLKRRGVRFEFFNKVTDLRLTPDQKQIGAIDVAVQATVKANVAAYNPLFDVKDLACWPSAPLYDQLVQGQALKDEHIDLESAWTAWQPVATKTLELGKDFDQVVLGISVAALPYITTQLYAANPKWKAMLDNANSSQTQAMQLWMNINLEETGWPMPSPILDAYGEPFNTWAVMNQTLDKEDWPQNQLPFSIAYFCNNRKDAVPIPPFTDHGFPARQTAEVKEAARKWLNHYTGHLWPYATQSNGVSLDWSKLVDLDNGVGEERLNGQYFRANIDPTERYVTNAANTNQYRLKAGESGFSNLFLTGDWINNGSLNLGCVESTVISGLQCAKALTGYPVKIHRDF